MLKTDILYILDVTFVQKCTCNRYIKGKHLSMESEIDLGLLEYV